MASAITLGSADAYDVSVMAASWRIVQVTREPAAMVVSAGGRVEWMFRSASFRLPLTERGQRLHADTLAAAAFRERAGSETAREVDTAHWLDSAVDVRGTLLESTHFIPSLNQAISLLWFVEEDRGRRVRFLKGPRRPIRARNARSCGSRGGRDGRRRIHRRLRAPDACQASLPEAFRCLAYTPGLLPRHFRIRFGARRSNRGMIGDARVTALGKLAPCYRYRFAAARVRDAARWLNDTIERATTKRADHLTEDRAWPVRVAYASR